MRRRLLWLAATLTLATSLACDPGVYEDGADAGTTTADPPDAAAPSNAPDGTPQAACEPQSTEQFDGRHNAGTGCQNCHGTGVGGAPIFTLGGTLYGTPTGVGAIVGATITITDANGQTQKLISANNGNFWSKEPIAYPIKVSASLCPDTKPMVTEVTSPGDCNSSGCHALSAPSGRVHLP